MLGAKIPTWGVSTGSKAMPRAPLRVVHGGSSFTLRGSRVCSTPSSSSPSSSSSSTKTKEPSKENPLAEGIAGFYDASTGLWEDMWGDHLHHG